MVGGFFFNLAIKEVITSEMATINFTKYSGVNAEYLC